MISMVDFYKLSSEFLQIYTFWLPLFTLLLLQIMASISNVDLNHGPTSPNSPSSPKSLKDISEIYSPLPKQSTSLFFLLFPNT